MLGMLLAGACLIAVAIHLALRHAPGSDDLPDGAADPSPLQQAAQRRAARRAERLARMLPERPVEDRAPDGLPPLVPSPRIIAAETTRGLRELEVWLAEQAAA